MKISNINKWIFLQGGFVSSQGFIRLIDFFTAILILRFLSIPEYALYIIASNLLGVGSICSDLSLSQALLSVGAKYHDDHKSLSSLFVTAMKYRRILYFASIMVLVILAFIMTRGHNWSVLNILLSVLFVLISAWFQQKVSMLTSVLYIYHDSKGIFQFRMSSSLVRILLTVFLCKLFPYAYIALFINLVGIVLHNFVVSSICKKYINYAADSSIAIGQKLKDFVAPLIPSNFYYLLQGQIAIFLLTIFGQTTSIAQVGALGRLGQVIGLLEELNPAYVLPYFAKLKDKKDLIKKAIFILFVQLTFALIILLTTIIFPNFYLFVLGKNYYDLSGLLPFAILGPLVCFVGNTCYSLLLSQSFTKLQYLRIPIGISITAVFILLYGVKSTFSALILNLLLEVGFFILQFVLLCRVLYVTSRK